MPDKTQKITDIFTKAEQRFKAWLKDKPTGKFSLEIPVNEGGVRRPDYGFREKG